VLCRRCCRRCNRGGAGSGGGYGYERVSHELDREELDFKRALENQSDFDLEAAGESAFNATELEQIEMIENYRAKLVEDAGETAAAERGKDLSKVV